MQQVTVACLVHTISKSAILGRTIIVYNYIYIKWVEEITHNTHTHTNRKERKKLRREGKRRMKEKKENSR